MADVSARPGQAKSAPVSRFKLSLHRKMEPPGSPEGFRETNSCPYCNLIDRSAKPSTASRGCDALAVAGRRMCTTDISRDEDWRLDTPPRSFADGRLPGKSKPWLCRCRSQSTAANPELHRTGRASDRMPLRDHPCSVSRDAFRTCRRRRVQQMEWIGNA